MVKVREGITRANLEAISEVAPFLLKEMEGVVECPIPQESDVKITGLKNPTTVVVLGFATDLVLRQLMLSKKSIKYVVVVEPNMGIFKQTIRRCYIGDLLRNENIDWFIGNNIGDLGTLLYKAFSEYHPKTGPRAAITQHPEVIPDPFVFSPNGVGTPELRDRLTQIVVGASSQTFLSMGCGSDSYSRWSQTKKNFENLKELYNGSDLAGKFWDPIVVVGAGPSMEDFIKYAKEYDLQKKALIIAVDASLRRLLKEGIRPHIVVRCERKLTGIFDGVKRDDTKGILYAGYNWCDPHFFDLFDESIMLYRGNGVCLWTDLPHLQVNGGVSSGNAALELAWILSHKGNNVFLTGIDLCHIDGSTHVKGTKVEFDIQKSWKLWTQYKCNDGEERTTIPVWVRCRQEFETAIIKYNNQKPVTVYNLSEKGCEIHGTTKYSWNKVSDKFKSDVFVDQKIRKNLKKISQEDKEKFDKIRKESVELLEQVNDDLSELFNNLDDTFFNIKAEEQKIVKRVRSLYNGEEVFRMVRSYEKSMKGLWENPARLLDNFKNKWFVDKQFTNLILDTVQLDVFKTENQSHALRNTVESEVERVKIYCRLWQDLYQTIQYYVEQMIELLEVDDDNSRVLPKS